MSLKLRRFAKNPLLVPITTPSHWWEAKAVFNPAAAIYKKKIYLLYRAVGKVGVSNLGLAILKDPFTVRKRLPLPVLETEPDNPYERLGIEDPRISFLEDKYRVVYTATSLYPAKKRPYLWSHSGTPWRIRLSLVETSDFTHWQRRGIILPEIDSKDGALFPEKIKGKYALLHRIYPDIWLSFSENLYRFPKGKVLCKPRKGFWDNERIGAGAPPVKTDKGWLLFYDGVSQKKREKFTYHLGILLLDLKDPGKILYRSPEPILSPEMSYEKKGGLVDNVVFTCGTVEWQGKYYVYYGAGDGVIGVAYEQIQKITNHFL